MGCNLRDLANAEDINLAELKGKRVGIDAFLTAFQFLTTIRDRSPTGDGGLVLILPSEPRAEHLNHPLERSERPPLKHYPWETIEEMLNEAGWHYENAWYVSVHRSLGRVIVYATSAPQD